MGKYFENATLDGLWTRLVNKTKELYETVGDGSYTYEADDGMGNTWIEWSCGACGGVNSSGDDSCLNCGNIPDFGRSLINTGMTGIHDALLSYTGLERNTSATKLADYMKGIATCVRYIANGYTDYTSENTLEQIVDMLETGKPVEEYSLVLSKDLIIDIVPKYPYLNYLESDIMCALYNEAGIVVCEPMGVEGTIPFDFVNWAENYGINVPAGKYYATCSFTGYHPEIGDFSFAQTSEPVYYEGGSTPVESFDLSVSIDHNEETYTVRAWILDPSYSPVPDTIEISIYTEIDAVDTLVGSNTYYDINDITVDVRDIASSLNQYQEYRVYAIARKTGYENTSASGSFTWHFESTGGDVPPPFAVSIRIDETDVIVTPTDWVSYYQFNLYTEVSGAYVSDATRDVNTGEEYYTSLSDLFGSSLIEGISYELSVTAYGVDAINASASTTFTWGGQVDPEPDPEPEPELDYSATPDAVMEETGEICIQNYKDSKYNGSEVILTSRWYLEDGSYNETTYWYTLYNGYVYNDLGTVFQGEAYMSEAQYLLYIRDPDNESNATVTVRVSKPG